MQANPYARSVWQHRNALPHETQPYTRSLPQLSRARPLDYTRSRPLYRPNLRLLWRDRRRIRRHNHFARVSLIWSRVSFRILNARAHSRSQTDAGQRSPRSKESPLDPNDWSLQKAPAWGLKARDRRQTPRFNRWRRQKTQPAGRSDRYYEEGRVWIKRRRSICQGRLRARRGFWCDTKRPNLQISETYGHTRVLWHFQWWSTYKIREWCLNET